MTNIDGVPLDIYGLLHGCLHSELASKLAVTEKLYFLIRIGNTIIYIYTRREKECAQGCMSMLATPTIDKSRQIVQPWSKRAKARIP